MECSICSFNKCQSNFLQFRIFENFNLPSTRENARNQPLKFSVCCGKWWLHRFQSKTRVESSACKMGTKNKSYIAWRSVCQIKTDTGSKKIPALQLLA